MNPIIDLVERRPDLWKDNPRELERLLSGKRFEAWAADITEREVVFVKEEKELTVLDVRVYGKLLPPVKAKGLKP